MRYRKRDARHPVLVATFTGFVWLGVSQLSVGPQGSNVVQEMPQGSQILFAVLLLVSSVACVVSGWIRREPLGAVTEVVGMLTLATALLYYTMYLPSAVPKSWSTSVAFGFAFTALGCIARAGIVCRMIRHKETW